MHVWRGIVALGLVLSVFSVEAQEDFRTGEHPVIDGRPVSDAEFFATVAMIDLVEGEPACTGTVIAPTVVLSAAHCVVTQDENTDEVIEEWEASSIAIYASGANANGVPESELYVVRQIIRHPQYPFPGGDESELSGIGESNDIALFIMDEPITEVEPIKILPMADVDAVLSAGTEVIITGFGQREAVEGSSLAGELYIAETPYQFRTDKEFLAGAVGQPDTCPGDSGGPVYVDTDQGVYVIGASSRADANGQALCGEGGIYTLAPAYVDWIVQQTQGAYVPEGGGSVSPPDDEDEEDDCGCSSVRSRPQGMPWPIAGFGVLMVMGWVWRRR